MSAKGVRVSSRANRQSTPPVASSRQPIAQRLTAEALWLVSSRIATDPQLHPNYSPLVITGPAGSGKSQILREWFGRQTAATEGESPTAVLWDGRTLARELVAALGSGSIDRLHERFVNTRLVVIDGVEHLTAWDAQRMLAHLLDSGSAAGTVFVVALQANPIACRGLEPSLASRLAGGLVVSMPAVGTTPRSPTRSKGPLPTLRRIKNAVARHCGMTVADLVGPSRRRHFVQARGLAMYLARRLTSESLLSIGAAFGGRDHTTVLHGIRVVASRRLADAGLAADLDLLAAALGERA